MTLQTFKCVCLVHLSSHEHHKLVQSVKCTIVGYNDAQKGFVSYDGTANAFESLAMFSLRISINSSSMSCPL